MAPRPDALTKATTRLLRPLLRLLLRAGVTYPVLVTQIRLLYLEIAAAELAEAEQARTDSRISLMTGVHRKEIRRLRETDGAEAEPEVVTLTSQIIARWLGDPAFTADGAPRPLPRLAAEGASFESLVRGVTTDLRPRAVLDAFLAQGLVTLDAAEQVHLAARAFVPRPGEAAQLFYFGRNLHDHIAAASANLLATGTAPFPDLSVHYDKLDLPAATALEAKAREAAGRLLLEVNREAIALTAGESGMPGPRRRLNLGVYLYVEDEPASDRDAGDAA